MFVRFNWTDGSTLQRLDFIARWVVAGVILALPVSVVGFSVLTIAGLIFHLIAALLSL
jgi:hypothetical protein